METKFSLSRFDFDDGELVAEASTLGFPPGRWPGTIEIMRATETDHVYDVYVLCHARSNEDAKVYLPNHVTRTLSTAHADLIRIFND